MGKTRDTGFLTDCVFTDSSNNVGIGGSPSGSYKFEVTGTGRINSANTTLVLDTTSASYDASLRLNNNSSATTWGILQAGPGAISGGGMNMYTTGAYPFTLGTNGAERMRISTNGNVGIGTSSPLSLLQLTGNNATVYDPSVDSGQDDGGVTLTIRNNDTSTAGSFSQIDMMVSGDSGRAVGRIVTIRTASATSDMAFVTENANTKAERMRINSTGNVIIGGTGSVSNAALTLRPVNGSSLAILSVVANNAGGSNPAIYMECPGVVGGGMYIDRNTSTLRVWQAGDTNGVQLTNNATSWGSFSDERLKTDLITIDNAINKLSSIRAVTGRYKTDKEGTSRSFIIAQDVQSVFPEAVDVLQDDIGTLSLRYTDLVPLLVKAIQELSAKVTALENK
jgi:hypothetical protein